LEQLTHTIVKVQEIDSVDQRPGPKDVTAIVRVDPRSLQQGVDLVATERAELDALKHSGGITNVAVADIVAESVRDWARQWDALEKLRTDTTKPLNEAKRRVDALFKPGLDGLKSLRETAGELLGAWEVLKANRQREALAIATEAAQTGAVPELTAALNIANAPAQKSAGVTAKARWVARVVDVASLPLRFQKCIADEVAIAAYVGRFEAHQVPDPVKGLAFELVGGITQVRR
jgi:hypothetical protein